MYIDVVIGSKANNEIEESEDEDLENENDSLEDGEEDENMEDNENDNQTTAGKYIPPALCKLKQADEDKDEITKERLKRQLKGLLNR